MKKNGNVLSLNRVLRNKQDIWMPNIPIFDKPFGRKVVGYIEGAFIPQGVSFIWSTRVQQFIARDETGKIVAQVSAKYVDAVPLFEIGE